MIQKEYVGYNAVNSLESILTEYSHKNIFLFTGKTSYSLCGAKNRMDRLLADYETHTFCEFEQNPKIEDLNRAIRFFNQVASNIVIAIGGGSVIDMAKMTNFFVSNKLCPKTYVFGKKAVIDKAKPLIAIPTTAGSGSEATQFAVLFIDHTKYSVAHKCILPDVTIVDPQFTVSLPVRVTAVSGMDALSQAIESYWCINSNDQSKKYAGESIELIISNLEAAANNPTESARLSMAKAAHLSGKAINITKTTAPHAISYPLTSFFGIAHGHAVSLTLSPMLVYNSEVCDDDVLDSRGCDYVRQTIKEIVALLGANDVLEAKGRIDTLMRNIGLETKLSPLSLETDSDIETVITNGFDPARVKNNPRLLTEEALRKILQSIS